eukprot:gene2226-5237_t
MRSTRKFVHRFFQGTQQRTVTSFAKSSVIPDYPPRFSFLSFLGVAVVIPSVVYAGATTAQSLVEYIEDNGIWRPSEDD